MSHVFYSLPLVPCPVLSNTLKHQFFLPWLLTPQVECVTWEREDGGGGEERLGIRWKNNQKWQNGEAEEVKNEQEHEGVARI